MTTKAVKKLAVLNIMDSVYKKTRILLEDIGGGWYANQKPPKRNKIEKLSNIEKGIGETRAYAKRWKYGFMF